MSDNKKELTESFKKTIGWTEMRLFDTPKFIGFLKDLGVECKDLHGEDSKLLAEWYEAGLNHNLRKELLGKLLDKSAKPLFKENFLWRFFKRYFRVDLQIPVLFGNWTHSPIKRNTITNVGKKISADQVGGTTTAPVTAIAIGIGTPSATALGSEIATGGGSRGAATVSNQTTTITGDTERWVKTFTFTSSFAVTEEGLFNNNTSGGNMLASQSFAAVNVVNTDTLQITHNVKFA